MSSCAATREDTLRGATLLYSPSDPQFATVCPTASTAGVARPGVRLRWPAYNHPLAGRIEHTPAPLGLHGVLLVLHSGADAARDCGIRDRREAARTRGAAARARFGSRLPWLSPRTASGEPQSLRSSSTVVSGRVRLARSDVDRVSGTGACCRRAGDWVRCVLPAVR